MNQRQITNLSTFPCFFTALLFLTLPAFAQPAANVRDSCLSATIAEYEQQIKQNISDDTERQLLLADCYGIKGLAEQRKQLLESGLRTARTKGDREKEIAFLQAMAGDALQNGEPARAQQLLDRALAILPAEDNGSVRSELLFMLGNAYAMQAEDSEAAARLREALTTAETAGDFDLALQSRFRLAGILLESGQPDQAAEQLQTLQSDIAAGPAQTRTAGVLATLGDLYHRLDKTQNSARHTSRAIRMLDEASALARQHGDQRTESFAYGTLGSLAERFEKFDQGLDYSRVAIQKAQEAGALDLLFEWQWQSARLLEATDQAELALQAYEQSIETLAAIRPRLLQMSGRNFNRSIAPVYFDMANLLLTEAARNNDGRARQDQLRRVQSIIEQYRVTEIQDYFDDECVIVEDEPADVAQLADTAAVVYPIIFDDRIEVLTSFSGKILRHTERVSRTELENSVSAFRRNLIRPQNDEYLESGRKLYSWLIEPNLAAIRMAGVDTLVFVPDGILRTVPSAAFHDGTRFLVERFAVSNSLGLTLTSAEPLEQTSARVLAAGLTVPVENFSALPAVGRELDRIAELYPATEFRNQSFLLEPVTEQLSSGDYSIVHIATHGQFMADYRESFLLTYDGRMTMNVLEQTVGLRRYLNEPVELLMLSACQTAVGDERAALGLAGIALKSGARSAVATLWSISDDSTAELIGDFYSALRQPGVSKARALQAAQKKALANPRFSHPFYWSPYLLIGNWL